MITVSITREELVEKNACKRGMEYFDVHYPNGRASIEWITEQQIKLLGNPEAAEWVFWLNEEGLLPQWSLRGADLREVNMCDCIISESGLAQLSKGQASQVTVL